MSLSPCVLDFVANDFTTFNALTLLVERKGILPVKKLVVRSWRGHLSGARCRLACDQADATAVGVGVEFNAPLDTV